MTLYEKLLLLTYYNPRIRLEKRESWNFILLPANCIVINKKPNRYIFTDILNILTEKDFKQLIKCL